MIRKKWKVDITIDGIKGIINVRAYDLEDMICLFNDGQYVGNSEYIIHKVECIDE